MISAEILGQELTEEQQQRLQAWKSLPGHDALYREIASLHEADKLSELQNTGYGLRNAALWRHNLNAGRRNVARWIFTAIASAACVAAVIFGVRYAGISPTATPEQIVSPGLTACNSGGIVLRLDDGTQMPIDPRTGLTHEMVSRIEDAEWAQIDVGRKAEFNLVLEDGTQAWLGAESSLRIPSHFKGERRVALSGQVCLDVAHDVKKPFTAVTSRGDIHVLGTRFSITDYPGRPLSVTLERGSVRFTALDGKNCQLKPDQTLTYDSSTGALETHETDASGATAWTSDTFVFTDEPLWQIMENLSRWYDFETEFTSPQLRDLRFSGRLHRGDDLNPLLDAFSATENVKFRHTGGKIIISK